MSLCKECLNVKCRIWQAENRDKKAAHCKAWRARNRRRMKIMRDANNAMWRAIRKGEILRGTICETCGSAGRIEGAHLDYSQPLKVKWLCIKCHRILDKNEPHSVQKKLAGESLTTSV